MRGRVDSVKWHPFAILMIAMLVCMALAAPAAARRYTGIVVDYETGAVLYEHNADAQVYPASLTKMMTLYLTFEALSAGRLSMDTLLTVSRNAAGKPPTKLGLAAGSTIRVKDAILSLITKSANDMATVLAEALASSEVAFAREMTRKAAELGMVATEFRNANGLPNPHQKTTARDMANLGIALIRDFPDYYPLFATEKFTYDGVTYTSTNKLLRRYPGVDGIKTGYIAASGFNLVTSTVRDGRRLVAVVIGGRTAARRDTQMQKNLQLGFSRAAALEQEGQLVRANLPPSRPTVSVASAAEDGAGESPLSGVSVELISSANAAEPIEIAASPLVPSGDYGVQVGAFGSRNRAETGARLAVAAAPDMLRNRPLSIEEVTLKRSSLYRARLLSFSHSEATETCRRLKEKDVDCLVVRAAN